MLAQIAGAMHNYESAHGKLPPAVVYGKDGRTMHSWRVLILPYIAQEALYNEYRLDEPWDSEHNTRLLDRMPIIYAAPKWEREMKVPPNHTIVHCFHGPGAAFEGGEGLRLKADFPDGISFTLFFVEGGEPVPWTKPEEISYDPSGPIPRLRGPFRDGFRACHGDGSRRFVRYDIDQAYLRALITRNGNDVPPAR
jgi:hypothetical protein